MLTSRDGIVNPDRSLYELVFDRVATSDERDRVQELVLAAFSDDVAFAAVLDGAAGGLEPGTRPLTASVPEMYLSRISVAGFRGVGPVRDLKLAPGPGLTLVTGRNGSGKSSFAEAAELVLTGRNLRWSGRRNEAQWQGGWRNLHTDGPAEIAVDLVMVGQEKPSTVRMHWAQDADLHDRSWTLQRPPRRREDFDVTRWSTPLELHRPFLSYNELGSLLDSRPIDLYVKLHRLLGLGAVDDALVRLGEARRERTKRATSARDEKRSLVAQLGEIDDPRAATAAAALSGTKPDLDVVARLAQGDDHDGTTTVTALRAIRDLRVPDRDLVDQVTQRVVTAASEVSAAAVGESASAASVADVLDAALAHHDRHGDGPCPVCGVGGIDAGWRPRAERELGRLRESTHVLDGARGRLADALRDARALITRSPGVLSGPPDGIDVGTVRTLWGQWQDTATADDPSRLVETMRRVHPLLDAALADMRAHADRALADLDEVWRPLRNALSGWHTLAVTVAEERALTRDLKAAEDWLKSTATELRDTRVAPIAARSQQVWEQLRQESGVDLSDVRLEGAGNFRRMVLDVSVDGAAGSALGVMSQGELHALGLSLFLPRATAEESPFRFLVIDDPVQAMDPSKVDGLARTLAEFAQARQVIVFSHDDRLAAAVRRLALDATILEVRRQDGSVVTIEPHTDPVLRYLDDADALARSSSLPDEIQRELVSASCRNALDAVAIEKVQIVRLGRGESHAAVEDLLRDTNGTRNLLALALFEDTRRHRDTEEWFERRLSWAKATLAACARGGHVGYRGDLRTLVERTGQLVAMVRR